MKMAPGIFSTAAGDGLGEPMRGRGGGVWGDVPPDRRFARATGAEEVNSVYLCTVLRLL